MGLLLALVGLLLWLLTSLNTLGIILFVLGLILIFVPGVPYGASWYRGRRAP
jgi:hypothetical protein